MATEHAHPEDESLKLHGDALEDTANPNSTSRDPETRDTATGSSGSRAASHTPITPQRDPIPMPENGSHEKSHAAHLGHAHEQTKPADKIRQGAASNDLREPPMVVQRVGKQHR
jgi:hypothetical protein